MSEPTSYHGQPVLKAPVWGWEIPTYLFAGGPAGASAGLGYLAGLRGNATLSRRAWLTSSLSISASPPLLIADLGRPERFFYMLRMIKVTSPMSMGTWFLTFCGAGTSLSALHAYTGRLPRAAAVARPIAALSGLPLATYTGELLANTAVPAWHEASRTLPFVFGAGAALSAGGVAAALTPREHAGPARRLALGAAVAELAATQVMKRGLGVHAETFHAGRARDLVPTQPGVHRCGGGAAAPAWRPQPRGGGRRRCAAGHGGVGHPVERIRSGAQLRRGPPLRDRAPAPTG